MQWGRVRSVVRARTLELGVTSTRRLGELSPTAAETWQKLLDGRPIQPAALGRIETFLGGRPGTLFEVLEGGDVEWGPLPDLPEAPPASTEVLAQVSELRAEVREMRQQMDRVVRDVQEMGGQMSRIEGAVPRAPGRRGGRKPGPA